MTLRELAYAYVDHPNVLAFRLMLRPGEGTAGPNGYRTLFGGGLFDGFDDHPRIIIERNGYRSSAAGAYQFLARTWDECAKALGLSDFSPRSQDIAATFLIARRGALEDVLAGNIESAIKKCAREWASLPGSPYGQPVKSLAFCLQVYADSGGKFAVSAPPATQPGPAPVLTTTPPPPAEAKDKVDPISIVSMLAGVFAPLLRAKVEKAVGSEVGKPLVDNLLGMAEKLTGEPDPVIAARRAMAQPEVVAQLEQSAADWFAQVGPILDKLHAYEQAGWAASEQSASNAAARGERMAELGLHKNPQFLLAVAIIAMVAGVVFTVLFDDKFSSDMQSFVIGAVVGAAFTAVIQYFFGSSRNSAVKDVALADAVRNFKGAQ